MSKKNKAADAEKLTKKQRRKLAEKAERKAAEKAERKAAEKAARKRAKREAEQEGATVEAAAPTESGAGSASSSAERHMKHLDRVQELSTIVNDKAAKRSVRKAAKEELDALRAEGERLNAARDAARESAKSVSDAIDAKLGGKTEAEQREARLAAMQQDVAERQGVPGPKDIDPEKFAEQQGDTTDAEPAKSDTADTPPINDATTQGDESNKSATAPATAVEEIVVPSEAPKRWEDDVNGLGQYKVKRPDDPTGADRAAGKVVGYTRVTTYIDTLEDKSTLTKWKMRILLEGVAAVETPGADGSMAEPVTARVRDLVHRRDVAIAKARKADRKGKLVTGQLANMVDAAWGDFKKALDALADEVFEVGGGREKAQKGTDIHALCDLADAQGIDAVQDKLDAGEITPSDFADVQAYVEAIKKMGLKVVAQEQVVVNDGLKVAGRLDRIYMGRLPEIRHPKTGEVIREADRIARRYVGDIKTGRVDFGQGKIAQQIRMYADGVAYDPDTHERTPHRANKTLGILVHLPAGAGECHIYPVDLVIGDKGNKLSGEVRAFRNEGRRAIDLKTDLLDVAGVAE